MPPRPRRSPPTPRGALDKALPTMAASLVSWAWQERPLDPALLLIAFEAGRSIRAYDPAFKAMTNLLRGPILSTASAGTEQGAPRLPADNDAAWNELRASLTDPDQALYWLGRGYETFMDRGCLDNVRELLDMASGIKALAPVMGRLEAQWAVAALDPDQAMAVVQAMDPTLFGDYARHLRAHLHLAMGNTDQAVAEWSQLWRTMSWHTNLTLALHDLIHPPGPSAPAPTGADTAVLLYTWNKAGDLHRALAALAESDLDRAVVTVLDNGSTDATPQVLTTWQERLGPDAMHVETLPVNVGAPAARNWLLSLDHVRDKAWAAFLDDDILLAPDWLTRLRHAAALDPKAGAVGCRVTDAQPPHTMQAADFHLLPPASGDQGQDDLPVVDNCTGDRDTSLFTYTRPCLSVTGCCHMVRMDAVREAGPFDIRFSPSQFDDLERDMRDMVHGRHALYHGQVRVPHAQHSSLAQADSPAKQAHIQANKMKLVHLMGPEALARLAQADRDLTLDDLMVKYARVRKAVGQA